MCLVVLAKIAKKVHMRFICITEKLF